MSKKDKGVVPMANQTYYDVQYDQLSICLGRDGSVPETEDASRVCLMIKRDQTIGMLKLTIDEAKVMAKNLENILEKAKENDAKSNRHEVAETGHGLPAKSSTGNPRGSGKHKRPRELVYPEDSRAHRKNIERKEAKAPASSHKI